MLGISNQETGTQTDSVDDMKILYGSLNFLFDGPQFIHCYSVL
jgi:hypothetical protein